MFKTSPGLLTFPVPGPAQTISPFARHLYEVSMEVEVAVYVGDVPIIVTT